MSTSRVLLAAIAIAAFAGLAPAKDEVKVIDSGGQAGDLLGGGLWVQFGFGVPGAAASGDVLVMGSVGDDVGVNTDQGSAVVFRRSGSTWVEEQKLVSSVGGAFDSLGSSVAVDGDVIVLGGCFIDGAGGVDQGGAAVFRYVAGSWVEEQMLTSSSGGDSDYFGSSVTVSGDVIVVGSPWDDVPGGSAQGSATVFRWDGMAWVEEQLLTAANGLSNDRFGMSVAVSGNVIVVGAPFDDVTWSFQGSATVFRWNGASWVEEQQLAASNGQTLDKLGKSVAIDGDVIVAGAPQANVPGAFNQGAAYAFRWNGVTWVEEQELNLTGGTDNDAFGTSVSVRGNAIAVGAPMDDVAGVADIGSTTLFHWSGVDWDEAAVFTASDAAFGDFLGSAVALTEDSMAASAPRHDADGDSQRGAGYVYDVPVDPWTDMGNALAGVTGDPLLEGAGYFIVDATSSIRLSNAAPNAPAALFVALSSNPVPFKGGTLVPFPFLPPSIVMTDFGGSIFIPFVWPAGIPPATELWLQWAIQDAAAVAGVSLSNALLGVTPAGVVVVV